MGAKEIVYAAIEKVAFRNMKKIKPLNDDLVLLDSGLDSLCFAMLMIMLEDHFGFDPFTMTEDVTMPVTVGDLVRAFATGGEETPPQRPTSMFP